MDTDSIPYVRSNLDLSADFLLLGSGKNGSRFTALEKCRLFGVSQSKWMSGTD